MGIYVTRSSMPSLEEYIEEIRPIFESHHLTNMGPVYTRLKEELKRYLDVPELSMFVNGHMALETAIDAMGLGRGGGEVITTPFTFVSTTNAIVRNGLEPVFCDIKPDDYTIDPEKLEGLITDRTVAILPVHVYGNVCDVEAIDRIAKRHGLKVIYDAAHAFGVRYKGIGVGRFGDASMFSFHATKVFNTIEGGAVAYRDPAYGEPLHELKNFGIHGQEDVTAPGGNAKLDEFRSAMGICNLRHIDEWVDARRRVAEMYDRRLGGVPGIRVNAIQPDVTRNYAYYPVFFDERVFGRSRDQVFAELEGHDIHTRKYFYPAINDTSFYRGRFSGDTPVARTIAGGILTLPMYPELSARDVDKICDVIVNKRSSR